VKYVETQLKRYLEDLSAKKPAPGGGSASACVCALGTACLLMVVNFTAGKKGYEQWQGELEEISKKLAEAHDELLKLVDLDVEAYNRVSEVYRLPKDDVSREQRLQSALKGSCDVAFRVMQKASEVLPYAKRLLEIGNKNLITDVGCGVVFLSSGIKAARLNVLVNLKYITDQKYKDEVLNSLKEVEKGQQGLTEEVVKGVEGFLV